MTYYLRLLNVFIAGVTFMILLLNIITGLIGASLFCIVVLASQIAAAWPLIRAKSTLNEMLRRQQ